MVYTQLVSLMLFFKCLLPKLPFTKIFLENDSRSATQAKINLLRKKTTLYALLNSLKKLLRSFKIKSNIHWKKKSLKEPLIHLIYCLYRKNAYYLPSAFVGNFSLIPPPQTCSDDKSKQKIIIKK